MVDGDEVVNASDANDGRGQGCRGRRGAIAEDVLAHQQLVGKCRAGRVAEEDIPVGELVLIVEELERRPHI